MPVQRCQEDGSPGWKCGDAGKCYAYTEGDDSSEKEAKQKAIDQCIAIGEDPGGGENSAGSRNRFRVTGRRLAPAQRKARTVRAGELRASLEQGRARAERHEGAYVDALEKVFKQEAKLVSRRFTEKVAGHSLTAAAETSASTMVAVYPTEAQAEALAQPNGEPVEILHCTLAFLGETTVDQAEQAAAVIGQAAQAFGPLEGTVGGIASFGSETGAAAEVARVAGLVSPSRWVNGDRVYAGYGETAWNAAEGMVWWNPADWTSIDEQEAAAQAFLAIPGVQGVEVPESESAVISEEGWQLVWANGQALVMPSYPSLALPDVPGLAELRHGVCEALRAAGIFYAENHGWTPHVTLSYLREPRTPPPDVLGLPLSFDRVFLTRGDIPRGYVLGQEALVAAGEPPEWTPPHPDEVFRPDRFIDKVRTKSDPVRRAVIQDAIAAGVELSGIDFDITNPMVAAVLAKTGAKVTEITETTRLGIMRTIGTAYDEGLSIPDTAKLLLEAMDGAARSRAELIARTEMVGLVNGGELAASRVVEDSTGVTFYKRWLTAEGAKDPRHEDYEGLDGQTVPLEETFDVGGVQLMYPGDPDGPPDEVCNCRCTIVTVESPDEEIAAAGGGDEGDAIDAEAAADGEGLSADLADPSLSLPRDVSISAEDMLDSESLNAVFKTDIDGESYIVKPEPSGVIVDEMGEEQRVRQNITPGRDLERERAAYIVSRHIDAVDPDFHVDTPDLRIAEVEVQPGVMRYDPYTDEETELATGKQRAGLSKFVPDAEPGMAVSSQPSFLAGEEAVRNAGLFDAIIGNTDRHGGNFLLDGRLATGTGTTDHGKLWLIDHGLAFPEDNIAGYSNHLLMKQASDLYGESIDNVEYDFLVKLRDRWSEIQRDLGPLLPDEALNAMKERLDYMIENETRLPPGYVPDEW